MTGSDLLTFDGITQPIAEWALDYGIAPAVITARLERGLCVEQAITTPMVTAPGQRLTGEHLDRYISSLRHVRQRDRRDVIRAEQADQKAKQKAARAAAQAAAKANRATEKAARQEAKRLAKVARPTKPHRPRANAQRYTFDGKTMSLSEWAEHLDLTVCALRHRLKAGFAPELVFSPSRPPQHASIMLTFNGQTRSILEWCRVTGLARSTVGNRLKAGLSIEEALTKPVRRKAGVVSNLCASSGTGAGSTAQETPEITFSEKADSA